MLNSIEGIYRNGKIELLEPVPHHGDARVLVTFLPNNGPVDLRDRGVDGAQSEDLRARLRTFAEDWDHPEMDVYDEA